MKKDDSYNKRAFTIAEAAEYVNVSRQTIIGWVKKGLLPFEELPGRGSGLYKFRLIRKNDLDFFLNKYYHRPQKNKHEKLSDDMILLPSGSSFST